MSDDLFASFSQICSGSWVLQRQPKYSSYYLRGLLCSSNSAYCEFAHIQRNCSIFVQFFFSCYFDFFVLFLLLWGSQSYFVLASFLGLLITYLCLCAFIHVVIHHLEGKQRTPFSSRVATGISWSPLLPVLQALSEYLFMSLGE